MNLATEQYTAQASRWPAEGQHILAHCDDETIIVYQAWRDSIADFAVAHGYYGGRDYSYRRMSWIKPNFLWMMYRSAWATSPGKQRILAMRLKQTFFDELLAQSVQSSWHEDRYPTHEAWKAALSESSVRLQWDPDHDPTGEKLPRRAVQLGLRNDILEAYGKREILEIIEMTNFIAEQRQHVAAEGSKGLQTPVEHVYVPGDPAIAARLGLDSVSQSLGSQAS